MYHAACSECFSTDLHECILTIWGGRSLLPVVQHVQHRSDGESEVVVPLAVVPVGTAGAVIFPKDPSASLYKLLR